MPKPTVELNLFSQQLWLQRPNFFGQRLGEKSAHKLAIEIKKSWKNYLIYSRKGEKFFQFICHDQTRPTCESYCIFVLLRNTFGFILFPYEYISH